MAARPTLKRKKNDAQQSVEGPPQSGKKALGAWLAANNPIVAELFGQVGYDFVIVDHEHGPGDFTGAMGQLHALRSGGGAAAPASIIRVPWHDAIYIKRSLDIGMEGIMVPNSKRRTWPRRWCARASIRRTAIAASLLA